MAKFLDKMKNIFFEEEEIEEVEEPKKEQIIAKKIDVINDGSKNSIKAETRDEVVPTNEVITEKELIRDENNFKFPMMFEDNDFVEETLEDEIISAPSDNDNPIVKSELVQTKVTNIETEIRDINGKPHLYEKRVEKTFRPSPIISPIYGVLDKNYKKEEIVTKREVKISARSANTKFDVDTIRNKAYGDLTSDILMNSPTASAETELENTLYDMSYDNAKPMVDKITIGDAEEYFEDLGLEYNIDYKDNMKEKATGRRSSVSDIEYSQDDAVKPKDDKLEDNLFDLIESMYNKED